jgi:hypothetical protein
VTTGTKLVCPLCGGTLNIRLEGFSCEEAVGGAYVKGRVALTCSATGKCPYMHTTNVKTASRRTIDKLKQIVGDVVVSLSSLGPWETFAMSDKPRRKYSPRVRRNK